MSEVIRLTAPWVRAAKASSGKLREVFDAGFNAPGSLVLRISPKGLKTWTFIYRNLAGRQRQYRIGHYPSLSLGKVREIAYNLSFQSLTDEVAEVNSWWAAPRRAWKEEVRKKPGSCSQQKLQGVSN